MMINHSNLTWASGRWMRNYGQHKQTEIIARGSFSFTLASLSLPQPDSYQWAKDVVRDLERGVPHNRSARSFSLHNSGGVYCLFKTTDMMNEQDNHPRSMQPLLLPTWIKKTPVRGAHGARTTTLLTHYNLVIPLQSRRILRKDHCHWCR